MNEEAIFAQAIEIAAGEERDTFLDQACGDNQALRAGVEALLKSHDQANSFLEVPALGSTQATIVSATDDNGATAADDSAASVPDDLRFLGPSESDGNLGTLGQYEVLSEVGRGGLGVVLKARDTGLDRIVAIKVPASEYAAIATVRQRFKREAQSAAAVSHDHLVTIHAVAEDRGIPYLVMEYVDGISLQDAIDADGPLDLREILRIGTQTARGLAAAHAQGLVHRDIKPANILLENGIQRVKITDFGLARAVDDVSMTQTGTVAGTPQYMSPEQAHAEQVDHRSDLFSLGSVLYAMCTGRAAFRANSTMAVLKRVCEDSPKPIRQVNPEIPEWLCEIVEKLLEKRPDDRFQSAGEVADLLNGHLAHLQQPDVNPQPARVGPLAAHVDSSTNRSLKVVLSILTILGGLSVVWFFAALMTPFHGRIGYGFGMPSVLLSLVVAGLALNGARHVAHRSSYRWAVAGCIACMTPVSLMWLMALPLAMVALGTMMRRDVKAAFGVQSRGRSMYGDRTIVSGSAGRAPEGQPTVQARRYESIRNRWVDAAIVVALLLVATVAYVVQSGGVPNAWKNVAVGLGIQYPELSPWEDFRWDEETAYAKIDGTWYEVLEIESIPTSELIVTADAMYPDPKKRIVEDLVEVLGRIRRWSRSGSVTLSVRKLETDRYFGISVEMTETKREQLMQAIYVGEYQDGPSLAEAGGLPAALHPVAPFDLESDDLYLVSRDGDLVRIHSDAGSVVTTMVKSLGAPYSDVEGMALGPDGMLYASVNFGPSPAQLHRIDPQTGEATLVGTMDYAQVDGLNFDSSGTLLGVISGMENDGPSGLIEVNHETGQSQLISEVPGLEDLDSLVIDRRGRLMSTDGMGLEDSFYRLDRQGAAPSTMLAPTPPVTGDRDVEGLTVAGDGFLYGVTNAVREPDLASYLLRIDPETFEYANLGSLGFGAMSIVAVPRESSEVPVTSESMNIAEIRSFPGATNAIKSVAWFDDGSRVAATSLDGVLRVWDAETGDDIQSIDVGRPLAALAVSPDGRYVVVGFDDGGVGDIEIWNLETGQVDERPLIQPIVRPDGVVSPILPGDLGKDVPAHTDRVTKLAFADGGRLLMSCGYDGKMWIWHFEDRFPVGQREISHVDSVSISGDGNLIATGDPDDPNVVNVWSTEMDELVMNESTIDAGSLLRTTFSSDGLRLVTATTRGSVQVWDTSTGEQILQIEAHQAPILDVVLTPDDRFLVTGAYDNRLKLWDAATGDLLAESRAETWRFHHLEISADGRHILAAGGWRWDANTETLDTDGDFDVHLYRIPDAIAHQPQSGIAEVGRLEGHTLGIHDVLILSDDVTAISAAMDGTIRIWNVPEQTELDRLYCPAHDAAALAVSADEWLLASGHTAGTVILWDLKTREIVKRFDGPRHQIRSITFIPNTTLIAVATIEDGLTLWDYGAETEPARFPVLSNVNELVASPDGEHLLIGFFDSQVIQIRLSDGEVVKRYSGHRGGVNGLTYSRDWQHVAAGSGGNGDGSISIWDAETGELIQRLDGHDDRLESISYTADNRFIVSGSHDNTIRLWDVDSGREVARATVENHVVNHIAVAPNGSTIISGGGTYWNRQEMVHEHDYALRVWRLDHQPASSGVVAARPIEVARSSHVFAGTLPDGDADVFALTFTRDGQRAVTGHFGGKLVLWDVAQGTPIHSFEGHTRTIHAVAISQDQQWLASTGEESVIRLWNLSTGEPVKEISGHTGRVMSLAFRDEGRELISMGSDVNDFADNTIRVWDVETGEERGRITRDLTNPADLALAPDGSWAAVSDVASGRVGTWDLASRSARHFFGEFATTPVSVALTSDGVLLAAGYNASRQVDGKWDDPDNAVVRIWNVDSGLLVHELQGHPGPILSVQFSPDDRHVLSLASDWYDENGRFVQSSDHTVRIWDADTGVELVRFEIDRANVARWLPDGRRICTGVRIWDVPEELLQDRESTPGLRAPVDQAAATLFRRFERSIQEADSISLLYDAEIVVQQLENAAEPQMIERCTYGGSYEIKRDGKDASFEYFDNQHLGHGSRSGLLVSRTPVNLDPPPYNFYIGPVTRSGFFNRGLSEFVYDQFRNPDRDDDPDAPYLTGDGQQLLQAVQAQGFWKLLLVPVENVRFGPASHDDADAILFLEYELRPSETMRIPVKLWVDAETLAPLTRIIQFDVDDKRFSFTEHYRGFSTDEIAEPFADNIRSPRLSHLRVTDGQLLQNTNGEWTPAEWILSGNTYRAEVGTRLIVLDGGSLIELAAGSEFQIDDVDDLTLTDGLVSARLLYDAGTTLNFGTAKVHSAPLTSGSAIFTASPDRIVTEQGAVRVYAPGHEGGGLLVKEGVEYELQDDSLIEQPQRTLPPSLPVAPTERVIYELDFADAESVEALVSLGTLTDQDGRPVLQSVPNPEENGDVVIQLNPTADNPFFALRPNTRLRFRYHLAGSRHIVDFYLHNVDQDLDYGQGLVFPQPNHWTTFTIPVRSMVRTSGNTVVEPLPGQTYDRVRWEASGADTVLLIDQLQVVEIQDDPFLPPDR